MTEPSQQLLGAPNRFPLSYPQRAGYEVGPGALNPRFIMTMGFRITGYVDTAMLQAALNDVVERHELLRTTVVFDVESPYQQVHPASPVPLEVRDLPPDCDRSREQRAVDLLAEADRGSLDLQQLPLLRVTLARFDDQDYVLTLITHHVPCDGWSLQLVMRDLAACYAARVSGGEPALPPAVQYREFAAWQREQVDGPASAELLEYWRAKLGGGRKFALPTDRPIPDQHHMPYSEQNFTIDAEVLANAGRLARQVRGSTFMVMLAAFNLLAHQLTGTTDPMINTTIHGRGQPEFADTVGTFLNWLPLRTALDGCVSFRDVLLRTRATCFGAYSHEIPIQHIEAALPEISEHFKDRHNCNFIFGFFHSSLGGESYRIADRTEPIYNLDDSGSEIPGGAAWSMIVRQSGELFGCLQYNPEEFDEKTVAGWVSEYCRLVEAAVLEPDQDWRVV
jgi:hypothetical protein